MSESARLDHALVSGMAWTAAMRWSSQIISWVATFYAARILLPSDYGIASMAMVSIGYARMVEDFGLDSVFLQDRGIERVEQARLAGFVVLLGVLFCALYQLLAHPIAVFFGEPQVAWAIMALSLLFVTDALQVVPRAALQRDLAFSKLALVAFLQLLVTQAVLVATARAGWGYKALVANNLAGALFATALLYYWRPSAIHWPRQIRTLARPLLQGWRMLASRLAYYAYSTADQTIIGRMLGKDALGAYGFAQTFSTTAMQEVGSVITKVVPGVFSAAQRDRSELRRYFLLLTELIAYLTFPMSIGIGLIADQLVHLVLGPQWDAVIAPLRLLCLYTAFNNSQLLVSHLMIWTGQFRAQMWCTIATVVTLPFSFLVGARYGLEGIALCWVIVYPLSNIPALIYGFRTIDITAREWFDTLFPALVGCIVMSAGIIALRLLLPPMHSQAVACAVSVGCGALLYCATLWLLFRKRLLRMLQLVKALKQRGDAPAEPQPA